MENVYGNKKGKESPKSMEQVDTKRCITKSLEIKF